MLSFTTGKCKYKINIYKLLLGVLVFWGGKERKRRRRAKKEDCENGLNALLKALRTQDLGHSKRQPIELKHLKEQKKQNFFPKKFN